MMTPRYQRREVSRRIAEVRIHKDVFHNIFGQNAKCPAWKILKGIPEGTNIIEAKYDIRRDELVILIEHASFPEFVPECGIQQFNIELEVDA